MLEFGKFSNLKIVGISVRRNLQVCRRTIYRGNPIRHLNMIGENHGICKIEMNVEER